jgi:hypothetical protein
MILDSMKKRNQIAFSSNHMSTRKIAMKNATIAQK